MFTDKEKTIKIIEKSIEKSLIYSNEGEVASYIPELANVNPRDFALSIVCVNGQEYNFGDYNKIFSIQSISKVISLIMAVNDNSIDEVFEKVGTEPTKYKFNSLIPIDNIAANPFINAGAITTSSLIKGKNSDEKFNRILAKIKKLSNSDNVVFMEEVYKSEMNTTDVNRSIAYYLKSKNIFSLNAEEVLDLYIRNCSIGMNSTDLAHIGALLANNGKDLESDIEIISNDSVKIVLAQMASCGMYEKSGSFLLEVGIPSKAVWAGQY